MKAVYFNEKVSVIEEGDDTYLVRFKDGYEEIAPKSEVTIYKKGIGRNPKRTRNSFRRDFGTPERVTWFKSQPCVVCQGVPSVNAHTKSRGAGGTSKDIIPLCHNHHQEQHQGINTFETKYGLNLKQLAKQYNREYQNTLDKL